MTDFFSSGIKVRKEEIVEQVQPEMREFCCKSSFFSVFVFSSMRECEWREKKHTKFKFSIPLTFCTHSILHNIFFRSDAAVFFYLFHAWLFLPSLKWKRLDIERSKYNINSSFFHAVKNTCFSSASRFKCSSMMMFFVVAGPEDHVRVCYHSVAVFAGKSWILN